MEAGKRVKEEGAENDLLDRIAKDPAFHMSRQQLEVILKPENFTGCAAIQTEDFIKTYVTPILDANRDSIGMEGTITV